MITVWAVDDGVDIYTQRHWLLASVDIPGADWQATHDLADHPSDLAGDARRMISGSVASQRGMATIDLIETDDGGRRVIVSAHTAVRGWDRSTPMIVMAYGYDDEGASLIGLASAICLLQRRTQISIEDHPQQATDETITHITIHPCEPDETTVAITRRTPASGATPVYLVSVDRPADGGLDIYRRYALDAAMREFSEMVIEYS